jgi:hypothetical protein
MLGIQFAALANATGLKLEDVLILVEQLVAQGLSQYMRGYQITALVKLVHRAPGVVQ